MTHTMSVVDIFIGVVLADAFMISLRWLLHRIAKYNEWRRIHAVVSYRSLGRLSQEDLRVSTDNSQKSRDYSAN
jgi:hypothetical protein